MKRKFFPWYFRKKRGSIKRVSTNLAGEKKILNKEKGKDRRRGKNYEDEEGREEEEKEDKKKK